MKLRQIKPNQTELEVGETIIFFSYATPVCVDTGEEILQTETKYSVTTSKHINQWLNGRKARLVPQSEIDSYV